MRVQPQTEHVQGHNCPGEQQAQRNGGGDSGQELSRGRARVAIEKEPYSLQGEEGRRPGGGGGGLRGGKGTGGPAAVQQERGREGEEDAGHEKEQAEDAQGERARRQRRDGEFGGCG